MTIDTLFGTTEEVTTKPKSVKFKQLKTVYENMTMHISEEVTNYLKPTTRYTSPVQIFQTFKFLQSETREIFLCVHLSNKNTILCIDMVSQGSMSQSIVQPVEVFAPALLSKASSLIFIHNHPSLDPTESSEDRAICRRLKECSDLLSIRILDFIIIGETYLSFVEAGLL
jgi:DNA repair protein RadC